MAGKLPSTNLLVNTINGLTKRDLIFIVVILLLLGFIAFLMISPDNHPEQNVATKVTVKVPGKKSKSDTIFYPQEVIRDTTIYKTNPYNQQLADKFARLQEELVNTENKYKDSLALLNIYLDAITERNYKLEYVDPTQRVTVSNTIQGRLLKQSIDYEIFPTTATVDTTVNVRAENVRKLFILAELGAPLQIKQNAFVGKGTMIFKNKKDQLFSFAVDTEAYIWGGLGVKF